MEKTVAKEVAKALEIIGSWDPEKLRKYRENEMKLEEMDRLKLKMNLMMMKWIQKN